MEWIQHHNPDLVIIDATGKEKERININGMKVADLKKLLKEKNFKKRA